MQLSLFDSIAQVFQGLIPLGTQPRTHAQQLPQSSPVRFRNLQLPGSTIQYALKRSKRRTIGFLIDDAGLTVTAPKWVTLAEIDEALKERETWIIRKSVEWQQYTQRRDKLKITWVNGASIQWLGSPITIQLSAASSTAQKGVALRDKTLLVALPDNATDEQIKNRVQAWLQTEAKKLFAERIEYFGQKLDVKPSRWSLSSARTRWGSCSADGSIKLNWRLMHFPLDIIDYVIAHELAHLRELNHSADFWRTVEDVLPDYAQKRAWLKQFPADS